MLATWNQSLFVEAMRVVVVAATAGIEHQRHETATDEEREQDSTDDREVSVKRYGLPAKAKSMRPLQTKSTAPTKRAEAQQQEVRASHSYKRACYFCHGAARRFRQIRARLLDLSLAGGLDLGKLGGLAPLAFRRGFVVGRFSG